MSTKSFDRTFVVSNDEDIKKFKANLKANHDVIVVRERNIEHDSKNGVKLLKSIWSA